METSRGCWWGAKHHCTFCGLNGDGMAYRSKSPERVLEEMAALVEQYGVPQMEVVDNILDMKYFRTVLPHLAERPIAELFYEIKANLTRDQVRLLARSNIRWIQPGIESLSDRTLQLMRKGVTALQNIQLLKWCTEDGIWPHWGYLFGFPGESEEELSSIARDMEAIHHLAPAVGATVLHLDRFSPYFHSPQDWGLTPVRPIEPYYHVYPFPDESVRRIAYIYDSDFLATKRKGDAIAELRRSIDAWRQAHEYSHLLAIPRAKRLILLDTRPRAKRFLRQLTGLRRRLYEDCDRIRSESDIVRSFASEATPEQVRSILRSFVEEGLMLVRDGRYLGLATRLDIGYRAYFKVPAGGSISAKAPDARRRSRVWDALALRIPPRALAGAAVRRLRRARTVQKSRIALRLGRMLAHHAGPSPH